MPADAVLSTLPALDPTALAVAPDALGLALAGTSFVLGARHGLDWDHIAAITDLTAPRDGDGDQPRRHARRGLGLSTWYCLGHGLVLFVLGLLVLVLAVELPPGTDTVFQYAVGTTLLVLGGVVLFQLGRYRSDYRYTGRISLVVGALRRGWARARRREVPATTGDVDLRGAFIVGLLHGTGAEALDRAGDDQHLVRSGKPAHERGDREEGEPAHEDEAATQKIGRAAR